jgi:hypothetical protein
MCIAIPLPNYIEQVYTSLDTNKLSIIFLYVKITFFFILIKSFIDCFDCGIKIHYLYNLPHLFIVRDLSVARMNTIIITDVLCIVNKQKTKKYFNILKIYNLIFSMKKHTCL